MSADDPQPRRASRIQNDRGDFCCSGEAEKKWKDGKDGQTHVAGIIIIMFPTHPSVLPEPRASTQIAHIILHVLLEIQGQGKVHTRTLVHGSACKWL